MCVWGGLGLNLVPRAKFLQPLGYRPSIKYVFRFTQQMFFDCLCGLMAQLEFVKHKLPTYPICIPFKSHRGKQCPSCQWTKITRYYQPQPVLTTAWTAPVTWYERRKYAPKYCKTYKSKTYAWKFGFFCFCCIIWWCTE